MPVSENEIDLAISRINRLGEGKRPVDYRCREPTNCHRVIARAFRIIATLNYLFHRDKVICCGDLEKELAGHGLRKRRQKVASRDIARHGRGKEKYHGGN